MLCLLFPCHAACANAVLCCAVLASSCSATGFTFQLRPASSTLTPATPLGTPGSSNTPGTSRRAAAAAAGDSEGGSGWDSSDEGDEEEEVTFVPISLGTAEASMPEYLKVWGCCGALVGNMVVCLQQGT